MDDANDSIAFRSSEAFNPSRIHAAAVYCSDGRMGEHFDEFLQRGLALPRYDRLALPGGAACLAEYFDAWRERDAALDQLKFLVEVHGLARVVLVAHEGCAFYTQRLRVSALGLKERQREDLLKAAARVQGFRRDLIVEAYYAHVQDGLVGFELVK